MNDGRCGVHEVRVPTTNHPRPTLSLTSHGERGCVVCLKQLLWMLVAEVIARCLKGENQTDISADLGLHFRTVSILWDAIQRVVTWG